MYTNNEITRPNRASANTYYALTIYYSNRLNFSYNNIHNLLAPSQTGTTYDYGTQIYYCYGESQAPVNIFNNWIASESAYTGYGLRVYYSRYAHSVNNTIALIENPNRTTAGTKYGFYHYVTNNAADLKNVVKNNVYIQYSTTTSTSYPLNFYDGGQTATSANLPITDNNNVFVVGGGTKNYYFGNATHTTYAAFKTKANAVGCELSGLNEDPQFISLTSTSYDVTPQNTLLDGAGALIGFVNDDYNKNGRQTPPTIGAIEMNPTTCVYPVGLSVFDITDVSAKATWTAISGMSGYEYYIDTVDTIPTAGTSTVTSMANFTNLIPGQTYYVFVRSKCSGSTFSAWNIDSFTTFATPCLPATGLQVFAGSSDVTLKWTPSASTPDHEYAIVTTRAFPNSGFTTTNIDTAYINGLSPNTKYFVYLRSQCSGGQNGTWLIDSFTTCFVDVATIVPNNWYGCTNDTVVIKAPVHSSYQYQWINDNTAIAGANQSVFIATTTGKYHAVLTNASNASCNKQTDTLTFTVHKSPTVSVDTPSGMSAFCYGDSLLLKAYEEPGYQFQWYMGRDGELVGQTDDSFYVRQTGLYKVVVEANGCKDSSNLIFINANLVPSTELTITGNKEFCEGDSVIISGIPILGVQYQWYKDGSAAPLGNGSTMIAKETGIYYLHATDKHCSGISETVEVTAYPKPKPVITQLSNDVLTALTGYISYQWYYNGNPVGNNSNTYNAGNNYGFYSVEVIEQTNGCSGISDNYNYTNTTDIDDVDIATSIQLYPNPTNGKVYIETSIDIVYDLLSVDGKVLASQQTDKTIDLTNKAPGIYSVRIYNIEGAYLQTIKVTKN